VKWDADRPQNNMWKIQDRKMMQQISRLENAQLDNDEPNFRAGKWKIKSFANCNGSMHFPTM